MEPFLFLELLVTLSSVMFGDQTSLAQEEGSYVEYIPGNINLLISVPHDGNIKLDTIMDRRNGVRINGTCNYEADLETAQPQDICKIVYWPDVNCSIIGKEMAEEYKKISGNSPHLVIAHIHRSKIDFNRDIYTAAQNDDVGEDIYTEYHNTLQSIRSSFKGPGLLIDLHGQSHKQNASELGYVYKNSELIARNYSRTPSVRSLLERKFNSEPEELLFGNKSLGALFEREGFMAIPSPRQPFLGTSKYYRGGYITQTYGSTDGGEVDAIQIEAPSESRFEDGVEARIRYSKALARILKEFFETNYPETETTED